MLFSTTVTLRPQDTRISVVESLLPDRSKRVKMTLFYPPAKFRPRRRKIQLQSLLRTTAAATIALCQDQMAMLEIKRQQQNAVLKLQRLTPIVQQIAEAFYHYPPLSKHSLYRA